MSRPQSTPATPTSKPSQLATHSTPFPVNTATVSLSLNPKAVPRCECVSADANCPANWIATTNAVTVTTTVQAPPSRSEQVGESIQATLAQLPDYLSQYRLTTPLVASVIPFYRQINGIVYHFENENDVDLLCHAVVLKSSNLTNYLNDTAKKTAETFSFNDEHVLVAVSPSLGIKTFSDSGFIR